MGKVVVAVKASSSGGASGLTRYIAESKRKPEKEGLADKEPRPLFSQNKDGLTVSEANQILQLPTDTQAQREDLIHLVISPEPGQFEELGNTREERVEAFKEIIREAAEEIEKEVNFVELSWIAGIHLNTDIPHAHLAISREGWDRATEKGSRINHVPRTLLAHHEKDDLGDKVFVPGKIAERVSQGIERQRQIVLLKNLAAQTNEREPKPDAIPTHDEPRRAQSPVDTHQRDAAPEPDRQPINDPELIRETDPVLPAPAAPEQTINCAQDRPNEREIQINTQPYDSHEEPLLVVEGDQPDTHSSFSTEPEETNFEMHEPSEPIEELRKPPDVSEHLWRDRYVLGRSMVARGEVDRLQSDIKSTKEHGDKRRFRVFDATHGHTRQISEFDIRRRADASAATAVRQAEILKPEQRQQARQNRYDLEIDRHEKGIGDHQIIVAKTIHKLEGQLAVAQTQHAELKPHVSRIQQHYNANRLPLPVPLLRSAEVNKLQDQAIAARNPTRVETIEKIRENLAAERGEGTRSDHDVARLDGQLLTARSEQAARQERAFQFERTRHQTRFEIDDKKYSLTEIDRRISEQENRSYFFGTPLKISTLHLRPSTRREAALQVKELKEVRELVVEKIEARRQELSEGVKEASRMTSVLADIHVKEQARLIERNGQRREKILTRSEITHLIEHGNVLADPAMLQHAFILEARHEERQTEDKKPSLNHRAARAIGRETLSEIALRQATEKFQSFKEHKQFTPVAIKDLQGREQTARLFDFRHAKHPVMWALQRITESKEHRHLRRETAKAVAAEHALLRDEVTKASHCHEITKALSDSHREQLHLLAQPIPDASFTPKQIIQLEVYATRHSDPLERMRVETLVYRAESATHQPKPTHQGPDHQQLSSLTPGEHLRRSDLQRNDRQHSTQSPSATQGESFHLPEKQNPSHAHLPQRDQQQPTVNPSLNPADPAKETPDLDLLR